MSVITTPISSLWLAKMPSAVALPNRVLVIYYEDRFAPAGEDFMLSCLHLLPVHDLMGRQVDFEHRSRPGLALDGNESAMTGDDTLNRGQSEPSASARLFGGEKWVEDSANDFRRDAVARVGDSNDDVFAGAGPFEHPRVNFI
jgi:hypothetical protein